MGAKLRQGTDERETYGEASAQSMRNIQNLCITVSAAALVPGRMHRACPELAPRDDGCDDSQVGEQGVRRCDRR